MPAERPPVATGEDVAAPSLKSRMVGGMVGGALGDAIGEIANRFDDPGELRAWIDRTDVLTYTDDTVMAVDIAESLLQFGDIEEAHLGEVFRASYARESWRGYGFDIPQVFARVARRGDSYADAAKVIDKGRGSATGGAASRIAPVGLYFRDSPSLRDKAEASAHVTHAHPVGIDGAATQAWAVARVAGLDPGAPFPFAEFCEGIVRFAVTNEIRVKLAAVVALLAAKATPEAATEALGTGPSVDQTMPLALFSFLRDASSFEACVLGAVLHGGKKDAVGAMAGVLSGAYLGLGALPTRWRGALENETAIRDLAGRLADHAG